MLIKKSISYSQALWIQRICSIFETYYSHSKKRIEKFVDKGYQWDVAIQQTQKVDKLDKKQLFYQQMCNHKQCIPLSVAYSCVLPNPIDILTKHWYIVQGNQSCNKTVSTFPTIALRKE